MDNFKTESGTVSYFNPNYLIVSHVFLYITLVVQRKMTF